MKYRFGLLILVSFLSGCLGLSKVVIKPSDLEGKGLLVVNIVGNNIYFRRTALRGDVYISGERYKTSINDNYIVLPLKPGKYNFEKIGAVTASSMPGAYTNNTYSHFPMNRQFTIKKGGVTNLGLIYAHFSDADNPKFRTNVIKNNKQIKFYLKNEQPELYKTLKKNAIRLEKGRYLSSSELKKLRKSMAIQLANSAAYKDKNIVSGNLGLIAQIKRNSKKQVTSIKPVNTGSLDRISYCRDNKYQYACVVPNKNSYGLLTSNYKKIIKSKKLPNGLKSPSIFVLGKKYILLVDGEFNLYESRNSGRTFKKNSSFKLAGFDKHDLALGNFYNKKKGLYVIAKKGKGALIFKPHTGNSKFKTLPRPKEITGKRLSHIHETKKGIVMGPYPGAFSSSEVYILLNNMKQWKEVVVPSASCYDLKVSNYSNSELKLLCGFRGPTTRYISKDSGMTWVKL